MQYGPDTARDIARRAVGPLRGDGVGVEACTADSIGSACA